MDIEETTENDEVTIKLEAQIEDLPANEDEAEDVKAGVGAALHLKPLTVGS